MQFDPVLLKAAGLDPQTSLPSIDAHILINAEHFVTHTTKLMMNP
jgi:hypothetical protein